MALARLASAPDALAWLAQRGVRALATDSRRVGAGEAFIAWPGHALDGRRFVAAALERGAVACLVEAEGAEAFGFDDARIAALPGLKAATGEIASAFSGRPSDRLDVIATTGTNGKTSTAWWVAQALTALGRPCGVIGTLGVGHPPATAGAPGQIVATGLTTPDPVTLQRALRRFVDEGTVACAIEASSIGVVEQRLAGTRLAVAMFTNFTQDHLDFHGSMDAYWQAKAALFAWPGLRAAVLNVDDPRGAELAGTLRGLGLWTCSAQGPARLQARRVRYEAGGLAFDLHEGGQQAPVRSTLIGDYNVSNLLAVIGALRALGQPLEAVAAACAGLSPVPGRMQRVDADGGPEVVVDYAHSPDALEKALLALQPRARQRGGALWCVFGCGGNRDTAKRPLMGAIAQRLAQRVVVTSDNPRDEAPAAIVEQVLAGMAPGASVEALVDRRAAIAHAVAAAEARDVVLIAGKGHEDYQEVAGVRHPFSDPAVAADALRERGARA